ncbi:2-oxoadipate dioxygenase/decarboxylase family protein [Sinimarinibacterium thermocellulolyticum]|uniref:2-oxoadipate dioxygenase/decarboxylase n=1 Tax=Sinimarinibacterium thermocellulolyticum TaxID=3170016 RepID=A0ABV2A976_9GAMM
MTITLHAAALRTLFVERATAKFARNVPDFVALQKLVADNGGTFRNDHGAIRSADPAVTALFLRAAQVLGLRRELDYRFPAKRLVSCDLQVIGEDASQFKIFVSQVDLGAFPDEIAALIRDDCARQARAVDHGPFVALIERFERRGGLSEAEAEAFVEHFVDRLMARNGPPLERSTLEAVAHLSGEAASALALGPDFNHVTIDVRAAAFDDIEAMAAAMQQAGFRMLPEIQGARGTKLRQTATMAATQDTPVVETDGTLGVAPTEKQFVEIIERNQAVDADGHPLWQQDGRPLIFRNFLAANAEKIFDAASTRAGAIRVRA